MTISNESRSRIKSDLRADRAGDGPARPDARRADAHRVRHHRRRRRPGRPCSSGSSAGSSSSSAASSTCSTARSPGRPARSARSARSWTRVFDRWGEVDRLPRHRRRAAARAGVADGRRPAAAAAMGAAFMVSYTRAKSEGLGFTPGTGMAAVGVMPREIRLVILSLGLVLAGILGARRPATCAAVALGPSVRRIVLAHRPRHHRHRRHHHRHPADPPCPQPGQVGRHHLDQVTEQANHVSKNGTTATARTARRRPTPGRAPGAAATARSASPSSASATAPAAWCRAATTTRTPRRTTSSRA